MQWYLTPEGKRVYSDEPCADGAKGRAGTAAHPKTSSAPVAGDFAGTWMRQGLRYHLSADGSLRCEKRRGGQLLLWRTGRWSTEGNTVQFHFTRYGGPETGGEGEIIDYVEKGEYAWTSANAFAARVGGLNGQWWDAFVRIVAD